MRINLIHSTVEIHFPTGEVVLIDREDLEIFAKYSWFVDRSKKGQAQYLKRNTETSTTYFHLEIMNPPKGLEIDHLNHNGLDNRKCNLLICTHRENQFNRPKNRNATTKFFGVTRSTEKRHYRYFAQAAKNNGQRTSVCWGNDPYEVAVRRENWIIQNNSKSRRNFS